MKIALIGYGKMGKIVERCAIARGHEIIACYSSTRLPDAQLEEADVCIDFSQPNAVLGTLEAIAPYKKPIVIGTTGWDVDGALPYAREVGILYAPNFSLGIALFGKLLKDAHHYFTPYFDVSGVEIHHSSKKDSPSGTALEFSRQIPGLTFQSVRSGNDPGTYRVIFDGSDETIELTHRARNREGYARGAIETAVWLRGKVGLFSLENYLDGR